MRCYIAIGSNLGNRRKNIKDAVKRLKKIERVEVKKLSRIYETEPVGGVGRQPKYLNGAIEIETDLCPRKLLEALQEIENQLGRKRTVKNAARTIDLDMLTYGSETVNEPDLKVPHPRMNKREFVLKPLGDIRGE